jgi:hypothetical protein
MKRVTKAQHLQAIDTTASPIMGPIAIRNQAPTITGAQYLATDVVSQATNALNANTSGTLVTMPEMDHGQRAGRQSGS